MFLRTMVCCVVLWVFGAWAQKGEKLLEHVSGGEGYTVLRVWGTAHEMGFAQGSLLPDQILVGVATVKSLAGARYSGLRLAVASAQWRPLEVEDELIGMVAGIKSQRPSATVDVLDLKVLNSFGDWSYACRSHSAWGQYVAPPVKTLSTRRLDFADIGAFSSHHVLVAREPSGGGIRWVNLSFAGAVTSVTGVNEYGTLASLHDYRSTVTSGTSLPRSMLPRLALTWPLGLPLEQHLDAVYSMVRTYTVMTGTFLNYYVPEGHGGVITCPSGGTCNKKRVPQADYFGGQVLLTTNMETDGHTAPPDDTFMDLFYARAGSTTLSDHFSLMGKTGLHVMSVAYRGRSDMTVWFEGRTATGATARVELEWSTLFPGVGADAGVSLPDAGSPVVDAGGGVSDGGISDGGVSDGGVDPPLPVGSTARSSCSVAFGGLPLFALVLLVCGKRRLRQWPRLSSTSRERTKGGSGRLDS